MLYSLYILYSFFAGILSFYIFEEDVFSMFLFLLLFEITVFIIYNLIGYYWSIKDRTIFTISYLFGYVIFLLLYDYNTFKPLGV